MSFIIRFYCACEFELWKQPWLNGLMYKTYVWLMYCINYMVKLTGTSQIEVVNEHTNSFRRTWYKLKVQHKNLYVATSFLLTGYLSGKTNQSGNTWCHTLVVVALSKSSCQLFRQIFFSISYFKFLFF